MANMDLTAMNAALKELYDGQSVNNLVYEDNPFLALVKKNTNFGGKNKPLPIIIGVSQGRSSTFADARNYQTAADIRSFLLTRKSDYSIATITNEAMLASKQDKMAFLEGAKVVVDGAFRAITLSLASALFRSGTGSIGKIAAGGIAAGVITLDDLTTVTQFEVNMTLQAAATDGGAPRAALGYIIAVNRSSGTVTVSDTPGGAAASPAAWVAGDYLLQKGDSNAKISGLLGWLPTTAPTGADNHYGVNRSVDSVRLAGLRYDGSLQSIEEAFIDASSLSAREGGHNDVGVTNFSSYAALEKGMGAKVQYVDLKGPGDIGFQGIRLLGSRGPIRVFADRNCPGQRAFLLQMNTWCLESLGDAPQILKYADGLEMLRVNDADAGEVRVGYYANLGCNAPGWNVNVTLGA